MKISSLLLASAMAIALLAFAGCAASGPAAQDADQPGVNPAVVAAKVDQMKMVAHGVNHEIFFKAPSAGRIYLYDNDSGKFIYRSFIPANGTFLFEPASGRAVTSKETVDLDFPTNARDEYQLYFVPR